jgi:cysteine synthase A
MVDAIGNTPLILIRGASERTGCKIYGKAEFLNPGGSVKDRAAKSLIEDLERSGQLKPGGTIVEGTAGNTGIGLSYVAAAKGYKAVIVIPRTQSQEKKDTLCQAGATLVEVDAMGYKFDNNYIKLSGRCVVMMRMSDDDER